MYSRNILFTLTFFLAFLTRGFSQFGEFGFHASLAYAGWMGEHIESNNLQYNQKLGGSLGIYFAHEFTDHFQYRYGVDVALRGFELSGQLSVPGVQLGANVINQSVYVDLPVLVRFYPGLGAPEGFFLQAGIVPGFLVYNSIEGTVLYNNSPIYGDPDDNAEELSRFDLASDLTIGYQFLNRAWVGLSWNKGWINLVKEGDYLGWDRGTNNWFSLSIGLDL
mgnify:CR=1 FL=1